LLTDVKGLYVKKVSFLADKTRFFETKADRELKTERKRKRGN
jgi:hypothetical protein